MGSTVITIRRRVISKKGLHLQLHFLFAHAINNSDQWLTNTDTFISEDGVRILCYLRQADIKVHIRQLHFCHLCSTGGSKHIEERGCANKNAVNTICNNVKRNFPPENVTCEVCATDFCNASSRRQITTAVLCFVPLSFVLIKILAPVTWCHQLLQPYGERFTQNS
jgi:hypothetical protein